MEKVMPAILITIYDPFKLTCYTHDISVEQGQDKN